MREAMARLLRGPQLVPFRGGEAMRFFHFPFHFGLDLLLAAAVVVLVPGAVRAESPMPKPIPPAEVPVEVHRYELASYQAPPAV